MAEALGDCRPDPDQRFAHTAPGGLLEGYRYATVNELTCGLLEPQLRGGGCVYTGGLRNVDVELAFMERFGKVFDRIGLCNPRFEGQSPQVYGEIWHATRLTDALLIDVDTQVANLQPARPLARSSGAGAVYPGAIQHSGAGAGNENTARKTQ